MPVIFGWYKSDREPIHYKNMKSHLTENFLPANPRFHLPLDNGLYQPIAFGFVTQTMHREIVSERASILAALPSALREQQERLFARYDPDQHLKGFQQVLAQFGHAPAA